MCACLTHKAGCVKLLAAGQVGNVVSVVVDTLHAAFKVLPPSSHRLPAVWHPPKTQLEKAESGKSPTDGEMDDGIRA